MSQTQSRKRVKGSSKNYSKGESPAPGNTAASWAEESALQLATKAPIAKDTGRAGPAILAAGAMTAKMPAPRIAASPVAMHQTFGAVDVTSSRASSVAFATSLPYLTEYYFCYAGEEHRSCSASQARMMSALLKNRSVTDSFGLKL